MARRNMKRGRRGPPFIKLDHPMFDSDAFQSLAHTSVRVLLSLMRRKNGMNGTDATPICCPYECMNGSMGSATIARAIRELEEKGFIVRTQRGGLYKKPNLFTFSGEWINWRKKQKSTSVMKAEQASK